MPTITSALATLGFAGCSLVAAVIDARTLRIPNSVSVVILVLFGVHALATLTTAQTVSSLALASATLLIGFAAYTRGWLGGGDAKLLAVCMAWAGLSHAGEFLSVTALAGGALAVALRADVTLPFADRLRSNWPGTVTEVRESMPYGVAIATGAIAVCFGLLAS